MVFHKPKLKSLTNILFVIFLSLNFDGICMERSINIPTKKFEYSDNIFQYEVSQQSGGSCGYHALYNGLTLLRSLDDPSKYQLLTNDEDRDKLFGSVNARWKKYIIENRVKLLARYYIIDHLFKNLKNTELETETSDNSYKLNLSHSWIKLKPLGSSLQDLDKHRKEFCNFIVDVSNDLANRLMNIQQNKAVYNISVEDIKEAFKNRYKTKGHRKFNKIIARLNKYFISFYDLNFEIISDHIIKDLNNKNEFYMVNWQDRLSNDFIKVIKADDVNLGSLEEGDWLSSEEIESLVQLEDTAIDIFCLELENVSGILAIKEEMEKLCHDNINSSLANTISNFRDKNYVGRAIFIMHYPGHWITCIITKNSDELPKLILADSLNCNRTKSDKCLALFSLLTGVIPNLNEYDQDSKDCKKDNTQEDNSNSDNDFLLPLDLLLEKAAEGGMLLKANLLVSYLKNKHKIDKNIFIYGPPKTGKFSLIYSISKLADVNLICTDAIALVDLKMFNKKDENSETQSGTNSVNDEQSLDIFLNDIKNSITLPVIIFIYRIDMLMSQADSEKAKASLINLLLDKINKYKKNSSMIFVFSSHLEPSQYPKGNKLADISSNLDFIKLDLPSYNKRHNIIKHYIENCTLKLIGEYKGKKIEAGLWLLDSLSTATDKFNCQDIRDFIKSASMAMKNDVENTNYVSYWQRLSYSLDFKNRTIESVILSPLILLASGSDNGYMEYFFSCCKLKAEEIKNREELSQDRDNKLENVESHSFNKTIGNKASEIAGNLVSSAAQSATNVLSEKFGEVVKDKVTWENTEYLVQRIRGTYNKNTPKSNISSRIFISKVAPSAKGIGVTVSF